MQKSGVFIIAGKLVRAALLAAITSISAFIRFPLPGVTTSVTATVFVVLLSGLILGAKYGGLCQMIYLIIGLCGVPVFSKGGGIGYIMQFEFGYLLGFPVMAMVTGYLRAKRLNAVLCCTAGVAAMYLVAIPYIYILSTVISPMDFITVLNMFLTPFILLDLIKGLFAGLIYKKLPKHMLGN